MIFALILIGLFSGIVAGMGMGGGTILIPLLTLVGGFSQQTAQAINLISFIPIGILVLIIYHKKKLLKLKSIWFVIIPGLILSSIASIFSIKISSQVLRIIFGVFLIIIGIFMIVSNIKNLIEKK